MRERYANGVRFADDESWFFARRARDRADYAAVILLREIPALSDCDVGFVNFRPLFCDRAGFDLRGRFVVMLFKGDDVLSSFFRFYLWHFVDVFGLANNERSFEGVCQGSYGTQYLRRFLTNTSNLRANEADTSNASTDVAGAVRRPTSHDRLVGVNYRRVEVGEVDV